MHNNNDQISYKKLRQIISNNAANTSSMLDTIADLQKQLQSSIQETILENMKLKRHQLLLESGLDEDKTMITRLHQEITQLKAYQNSKTQKQFNTEILQSTKNLAEVYQKRIEILNTELCMLKHEKVDASQMNIQKLMNITELGNDRISDLYTSIQSDLIEIQQLLIELIHNSNSLCAKKCAEKVSEETRNQKEKFERILQYKNEQIAAQEEIIRDLKKSVKLATEEKFLLQQSIKKEKEKHEVAAKRYKDEINMWRNRLKRIETAKAFEIEGYHSEIKLLKEKYKNLNSS